MKIVWCSLILAACAAAMLTGKAAEATGAILQCGQDAVGLLAVLLGSMTVWNGLMEILVQTGDMERFGWLLRRRLRFLFPGIRDEKCWSAMGLNMAANVLGLGNAATPAGIQAAQLLEKQGQAGVRALAMLLALNNSSLQVMPTTVITLRSAAGAANPADIWPVTLISSGVATVAAAGMMWLVNRGGVRRG
ncbi:MAG: spore maturation protein A [Clostridia bacterium]|nr:spore maturation protein A [Clostridia bacterium]